MTTVHNTEKSTSPDWSAVSQEIEMFSPLLCIYTINLIKLLDVLYQNKEEKQDSKGHEVKNKESKRERQGKSRIAAKENAQVGWGATSLESDQPRKKKNGGLQNICL